MNQYSTSYGRSYGERSYGDSRTFARAASATLAAPTNRQPMQQYEEPQQVAMESQQLYDYSAQAPESTAQWPYSTSSFPQRVAVPTKTDFYPKGFRLGYAKGRKTFAKTAEFCGDPIRPPAINFPAPTYTEQQSRAGYGKTSTSQRMPEGHQRRYHVPGYMGFVGNIQHMHGNTYGRTTRECMMNY